MIARSSGPNGGSLPRRAVVPLALVLALVTGVVLAEARLVVLVPTVPGDADPQGRASDTVIRRFYATVDDALASGDVTALAGVVAADFVDHDPRPGVAADRAGILHAVQSLHAVAPGLRLTVLDVLADGDRVVARVQVDGAEAGSFVGLPLTRTQLWDGVDEFRVQGGRVVEHWGDSATLATVNPLLGVTVPVDRPTRKAVTVERWTYAPDAGETRATNLGFLVILIDAGSLTIHLDTLSVRAERLVPRGRAGAGDRAVAPGATATLVPGDAMVVPQGGLMALRNDGTMATTALIVAAATPFPQSDLESGTGGETEDMGVVHQVLAGGMTADLPDAQATVEIGRVALAAGAEFRPHRAGAVELVAVETGTLAMTASDGAAWATLGPTAGTHRADAETVPAGGGALVETGTTVGYGTAGSDPLGLLLVGIRALDSGSEATTVAPLAPSHAPLG
ncbi:MAG TPA: ester cyclase [Thermomicrobiales bacterium]